MKSKQIAIRIIIPICFALTIVCGFKIYQDTLDYAAENASLRHLHTDIPTTSNSPIQTEQLTSAHDPS